MPRRPGASVRLKLALSYAVFLMVAGIGLISVVWVFLLRYVPRDAVRVDDPNAGIPGIFIPGRSDLWEAFAPKAAWMLLALLLVGLIGGWLLAGRMLAPLVPITAATRRAATGSLSHRIELPGPNDEFRELADAFDSMLARLEDHVAEQQRFAANASHELRTPLAITQTLLEVAAKDPARDVDALIERLASLNARSIDLTEALLMLSRADAAAAFAWEDVDLSLTVDEAVESLLPLAERSRVTLEYAGGVAVVRGSAALLGQMTMNLVHNAIVHNVDDGEVRVRTRVQSGVAVLTVENTGEQVDPGIVTTLTEPFRRGTDRVHGEQVGVGLGLAIVQRIVNAHGGTLAVRPRPAGGLVVEVSLPAGP